jgi:transposase
VAPPLSLDLRRRTVDAYLAADDSLDPVAARFAIGRATLARWLARQRQTGSLAPSAAKPGPAPKAGLREELALRQAVEEQPDATLRELSARLEKRTGVRVGTSAVDRLLARLGLTRKKKDLHASERDREAVRLARAAFAAAMRGVRAEDLAMTRAYARVPRGQRAYGAAPKNWGDNITLAAVLGRRGILALLMLRGGIDGEHFVAYILQFVVPELRPGHVLVLDNLSAHKAAAAREAVEACGAKLVFLPPYSPDLSPLERAWSVKALLRKAAARSWEALLEAVEQALRAVTSADAAGWFQHAGYNLN